MEILKLRKFESPSVVVIGKFDGVHKGHQSLMDMACKIGVGQKLTPIAYTFESFGECITDDKLKTTLLGEYGAEKIYIQPFTDEFKSMSPEDFVKLLKEDFNAKHIVVGFNFRFGKDRSGDAVIMEKLCDEMGMGITIAEPVLFESEPINSTRIRALIKDGYMDSANIMMGRAFSVTAEIFHGKMLGRKIGFPTANMSLDDFSLIPKNAVYATSVKIGNKIYPAITNIGSNPTVDKDKSIKAETHIIGFDGDLYGKTITVDFIKILRGETKFESVDGLKDQLLKDTEDAKNIFKTYIDKI